MWDITIIKHVLRPDYVHRLQIIVGTDYLSSSESSESGASESSSSSESEITSSSESSVEHYDDSNIFLFKEEEGVETFVRVCTVNDMDRHPADDDSSSSGPEFYRKSRVDLYFRSAEFF